METLITFLASFLIWFMFAGLFVLWVTDGRVKREQVLHGLLAYFIAWLVAELIKTIVPTARPFVTSGEIPLSLTIPQANGSFPSGHTAAAFALAATIWLHDRKMGWVYFVLALVVGWARILARVHYPIDVLGGAILGIFSAFVIEKAHPFRLMKRVDI